WKHQLRGKPGLAVGRRSDGGRRRKRGDKNAQRQNAMSYHGSDCGRFFLCTLLQGARSRAVSIRRIRVWKSRGGIKWSWLRVPVSLSSEEFIQFLQRSIRNHLVVGEGRRRIISHLRRQLGLSGGGR